MSAPVRHALLSLRMQLEENDAAIAAALASGKAVSLPLGDKHQLTLRFEAQPEKATTEGHTANQTETEKKEEKHEYVRQY